MINSTNVRHDREVYKTFLNRCLFATPIKQLRLSNKNAQKDFAQRITPQEYCKFEAKKANITINTLIDILKDTGTYIQFIEVDGDKIYKELASNFHDYKCEVTSSMITEPIKRRRKELKISQKQLSVLAELAGDAAVCNLEKNKSNMTIDNLSLILNALGLRVQLCERFKERKIFEFTQFIDFDKLPKDFIPRLRTIIK